MIFILFGSRFTSREDLRRKTDTCPSCGQRQLMESFSGLKWLHLYFIPLIPLGRRRVIQQCRGCKKGYEMSVSKWEDLRDRSIAEARTLSGGDPHHLGKTLELLTAVETYGTDDAAEALVREIVSNFPHDAGALSRAAEYYRAHGDDASALGLAERAGRADAKNDSTRRILASLYAAKADLLSAMNQYLGIDKPLDRYDMMNILYVAQGLRKAGRIREAYTLVEKINALYPAEANAHYGIRHETKILEKKLQLTKSILRPNPAQKKQILIASLCAGLLVAFFAALNFYIMLNQKLFVANELDQTAVVSVGEGPAVAVEPGAFAAIPLAEGEYTLTAKLGGRSLPPQKIRIANSPQQRFFNTGTFICNLAGAGIIVAEEIRYSAKADEKDEEENHYRLYTGKDFLILRGVEYPFEEPPKTIRLENHESSKVQFSVYALKVDPYKAVETALAHAAMIPREDLLLHMEGRMSAGFLEPAYVSLYKAIAAKGKLTDRAESFLNRLPKQL